MEKNYTNRKRIYFNSNKNPTGNSYCKIQTKKYIKRYIAPVEEITATTESESKGYTVVVHSISKILKIAQQLLGNLEAAASVWPGEMHIGRAFLSVVRYITIVLFLAF